MKIKLQSSYFKVNKILKKTKAKGFTNLKEGDIIKFNVDFERLGTSRGRSYAPSIYVTFNKNSFGGSFNDMANRLECFELEEVVLNED